MAPLSMISSSRLLPQLTCPEIDLPAYQILRLRPLAVPVLLGRPGRDNAHGRAVELHGVAEDGLHACEDRRMVEQEGETVVLFQQLSEEAAVRPRIGLPVPSEGVARVPRRPWRRAGPRPAPG